MSTVVSILRKEVALTKQKIRTTILRKIKIQKEEDRTRKSQVIKKKLFRTKAFIHAKTVMFFISLVGEVDTREMIKEAQKLGKKILVPVCSNRTIIACVLDACAKLQKGPYGVREPVVKQPFNVTMLDLVVVPGLAFEKKGARLGRGKGYYDRFLKTIPSKTASIGIAFDFQILPCIPANANDVSVKKVIYA